MSCHWLVYCSVRDFQRNEDLKQICLIFDSTITAASYEHFNPILSNVHLPKISSYMTMKGPFEKL